MARATGRNQLVNPSTEYLRGRHLNIAHLLRQANFGDAFSGRRSRVVSAVRVSRWNGMRRIDIKNASCIDLQPSTVPAREFVLPSPMCRRGADASPPIASRVRHSLNAKKTLGPEIRPRLSACAGDAMSDRERLLTGAGAHYSACCFPKSAIPGGRGSARAACTIGTAASSSSPNCASRFRQQPSRLNCNSARS